MPTLEQAKLHVRVTENHDDDAIVQMIVAATEYVANYLDTTVEAMGTHPAIEAAILLMVADLYDNRILQAETPFYTNRTFERLLAPYRVMKV